MPVSWVTTGILAAGNQKRDQPQDAGEHHGVARPDQDPRPEGRRVRLDERES